MKGRKRLSVSDKLVRVVVFVPPSDTAEIRGYAKDLQKRHKAARRSKPSGESADSVDGSEADV